MNRIRTTRTKLLKTDSISKKIQSIADSRVTQALATAKTKWEQERADEADEAKKLAKMTEAEKQKYQFEKDKKAFEAEKAKFQHSQLQVETAKQLISAGLPDLSAYITGKDAEETKTNITDLQTVLGAWKAAALKEMTAGKTPDVKPQGAKLTRADLKKMTPAEINRAYEEGRIDFS